MLKEEDITEIENGSLIRPAAPILLENGEWKMEHGTWNMGYGIWNLEHGAWNMRNGNRCFC